MISTDYHSSPKATMPAAVRSGERGAALATAILMLGLLSAVAMTVLAVVSTESRVAGSDLKRTQAFYAAASGIEKMSSDFNALFARTSRPQQSSMDNIAAAPPDLSTDPDSRDFTFAQSIAKDEVTLAAMRATQNIATTGNPPVGANPSVTVPNGPLVGLTAAVVPYILTTTVTSPFAQVNLERRMNNYLVPIFQFGMFSDEDMEIHPGPAFTFNGRVHANGNLYVNGLVTFLDKVTTSSEIVRDVLRNGATHAGTVTFNSGTLNEGNLLTNCTAANANCASVIMGPNLGSDALSPPGSRNPNWQTNSVTRYNGQLLTSLTGVARLKLPLQLDGNPTRDVIKRRTPNDDVTLSDSRYHTKAEIRILLDDEGVTTDAARSNASPLNGASTTNVGVDLSTFTPTALPNALQRVSDGGTPDATSPIQQQQQTSFGTTANALTVRGVYPAPPHLSITGASNPNGFPIVITTATAHGFVNGELVFIEGVTGQLRANNSSSFVTWTATNIDATHFSINRNGNTSTSSSGSGGTVYSYTDLQKSGTTIIPPGAGLVGHILIQIVAVAADGSTTLRDVTQTVLSMGVTEGEPNSIVALQRPLWMAYTQGSRDANATSGLGGNNLKDIMADSTQWRTLAAKGQVTATQATNLYTAGPPIAPAKGYLSNIADDTLPRADNPLPLDPASFTSSMWNSIVPINVYNVREGRLNNATGTENTIYERGMTSVVEINMKNLARWLDGAYDGNVLASTLALSANIGSPDGYIVYISDRRGDKIKSEVDSTNATVTMTNGMCDNEEIYAPFTGSDGDVADAGEDVIDFKTKKGTLQKDVTELPVPANLAITLPNNTTAGTTLTASTSATTFAERFQRANIVNAWTNIDWADTAAPKTRSKYFRRAVRLFNGEDLRTGNVTGKLSATKGITMASENLVYIWGNYNTSGINDAPGSGTSSLNDTTEDSRYCPSSGSGTACPTGFTTDRQVPTSIVCDAFFPLSRTWFDGESALFPDDENNRPGDRKKPNDTNAAITSETSVRTGIIAGNNISALSATGTGGADVGNWNSNPDNNESRLNGGMHNFPRFLEAWADRRFNFVGSLIPLYHSTQAMGQYGVNTVYSPPTRNWAFDITFRQSDRLPPGTPQFQYIEPTAFRQRMF